MQAKCPKVRDNLQPNAHFLTYTPQQGTPLNLRLDQPVFLHDHPETPKQPAATAKSLPPCVNINSSSPHIFAP